MCSPIRFTRPGAAAVTEASQPKCSFRPAAASAARSDREVARSRDMEWVGRKREDFPGFGKGETCSQVSPWSGAVCWRVTPQQAVATKWQQAAAVQGSGEDEVEADGGHDDDDTPDFGGLRGFQ